MLSNDTPMKVSSGGCRGFMSNWFHKQCKQHVSCSNTHVHSEDRLGRRGGRVGWRAVTAYLSKITTTQTWVVGFTFLTGFSSSDPERLNYHIGCAQYGLLTSPFDSRVGRGLRTHHNRLLLVIRMCLHAGKSYLRPPLPLVCISQTRGSVCLCMWSRGRRTPHVTVTCTSERSESTSQCEKIPKALP